MSGFCTQDKELQAKFYYNLGAQVLKVRLHMDLTQESFGVKFGFSRIAVVNIESGKQRLSIYHYSLICKEIDRDLFTFACP